LNHSIGRTLAILAVLTALLACGTSARETGPCPGCASGTTAPAAWKINLSHGLGLADRPLASEPATGLRGTLSLGGRDGGPKPDIASAEVALNGIPVPQSNGVFDFALLTARPAGVAPGETVRVAATIGSECTSVTFACPSATIAAPSEGSAAKPGGTVTITRQGQVYYPSQLYRPSTGIDTYSAARNERSDALTMPVSTAIAAADTSAMVTVPADAQGGYLIQLAIPGPMSIDEVTGDVGLCIVDRRVHLLAVP
jgi:hypothetical protein